MPKLKTNSSAKKRFRINGAGKIKRPKAFKRHGLRRRSARHLRDRSMSIIFKGDIQLVKGMMPNSGIA